MNEVGTHDGQYMLGLKVVCVRMSKRDSLCCHLNLLGNRIYFIGQMPQLANYTLYQPVGIQLIIKDY